jgi:hypothetical protein
MIGKECNWYNDQLIKSDIIGLYGTMNKIWVIITAWKYNSFKLSKVSKLEGNIIKYIKVLTLKVLTLKVLTLKVLTLNSFKITIYQ